MKVMANVEGSNAQINATFDTFAIFGTGGGGR